MATPRKRQWHIAETPGHGCCFSVGIQDAEGNMVADVVYREDGPLLVAAPDLYAALHEAEAFLSESFGHANAPYDAGGLALLHVVQAALRKADGDAA